jgi:hypothetical protein
MTAEIAIMNKTGVALAADSKVTIGAGIKAFDTVSKVFPLSRIHPVALMVWGNPDFMEIPIEIICKAYRAQKKNAAEQRLSGWADDFGQFLKTFCEHDDVLRKRNIRTILTSWFGQIRSQAIESAGRQGITVTSPPFVDVFLVELEATLSSIMSSDDFVADEHVDGFLDTYWASIEEVVEQEVGQYESDELSKQAVIFAMAVLFKSTLSPASMGFVIAGYGDAEVFPGLIEFESDGFVGADLKMRRAQGIEISRNMRSFVQPFAQSDMVHRFMSGADPDYIEFADALFRQSIVESCLAVLDEFGEERHKTEEVRALIKNAMGQSANEARSIRQKFCKANFSSPILNMVAMLPKDELPHLAESLVALTSLKRHVSHDAETVGGPIDVALISKGDGLIWIKRKHYFSPELNPQFTAKYLRAIMGGDDEKQATRTTRRQAKKGASKG